MNRSEEEDYHSDYLDNLTLLTVDLSDVFLNPHLHPVTTDRYWLEGVAVGALAGLGLMLNMVAVLRPPRPLHLPRLLAITDILILLLVAWTALPPAFGLAYPAYLHSTLVTAPALQGLEALSTYLFLVLIAVRFLSMMESVDYGSIKPVVSAIFVAITLFVPSMFERTTQELSRYEIESLLNSSLALNQTAGEDVVVVVRHTELYINFSYNNIFSLLYKFLVMQVVPVWTLLIVAISSIKRSKLNKKRNRQMDLLPAILSCLFLASNSLESAVFFRRILLYPTVPLLNRLSEVLLTVLYSMKPVCYAIADGSARLWCRRKMMKGTRVPTEDY